MLSTKEEYLNPPVEEEGNEETTEVVVDTAVETVEETVEEERMREPEGSLILSSENFLHFSTKCGKIKERS
ncbi:Uncharacterised protein [Streptococcus pneumoniae]|nr:hypothetical protein [Streptococcus pneumoniae]CWC65093.1 Uncharacterised protein [Streptococcus pneumoniae]